MEDELQERSDAQTWARLIEVACTHPRMVAGTGTFVEVSAWLNGYYAGSKRGSPEMAEEWDSFTAWLQKRLRYPRNWGWPRVFIERFPEDSVALEQLRLLHTEFLNEKGSSRAASG